MFDTIPVQNPNVGAIDEISGLNFDVIMILIKAAGQPEFFLW